MREHWARGLAIFSGLLVLLLSIAFALVQNPGDSQTPESVPAAAAEGVDQAALSRGRAVYEAQGCSRCHSIAGQGSPRSPLDSVGATLGREYLQRWIVADESVRDRLSSRAIAAKRPYADLPSEELDALVVYLASLKKME